MKKILFLSCLLLIVCCDKKPKKKAILPEKAVLPSIVAKGKWVYIDSLLLNPFDSKLLKEFYWSTAYKSVWQSKKQRRVLLEQFSKSVEEGLNPDNYNLKQLQKYEQGYDKLNSLERANYDVLLTRSLQKYILHATTGRFNARLFYTNWDLNENKIEVNEFISLLLKTSSFQEQMESLLPNHLVYKKLKKALKIINSYPTDTFSRIDITNKIVPHDTNPTLILIKKRLMYWGDLQLKDSLTSIYDDPTLEAMKKFQIRHGLTADGLIGTETIAALNYSKNQRKKQILANLERWKWFPRTMGANYCIVNSSDYTLTVLRNEDTIRKYKVIVGTKKRPSPVLSSKFTNVVFNPTWIVPPTIRNEDVIPSIVRNRNYLAQKNIKVYNKKGHEVSANHWKLSNAKEYRYIQSPGEFNSLGIVKFLFPNRFSVYLHDTNHRDYFKKHKRSLSSGCVRVDNPLLLAAYLLEEDDNWSQEKINSLLRSKKTKSIQISKNIPIHILYWTAWSEGNALIFREDIYNCDSLMYSKLGH